MGGCERKISGHLYVLETSGENELTVGFKRLAGDWDRLLWSSHNQMSGCVTIGTCFVEYFLVRN